MAQHEVARIPYLDGVRGVAILLVFVGHLLAGAAPHHVALVPGVPLPNGGGFIGVQLFFVLSGYLITSILVRERERLGRIDLLAFYGRRLRRLYPPLLAACAGYLAFVLVALDAAELPRAFGAVARALSYSTNVPLVWRGVPDSGWLRHTWSLAVEEQFYLLWPALLVLVLPRGRAWVRGALLVGFLSAAAARAVPALAPLGYALIRWDALAAGCWLAVRDTDSRPAWLLYLGPAVVGGYVLMKPDPALNLDFTVAAIGCLLFLMYAREARWVAHPLLRYFGRVSYSLYLWHVLVMRLGLPGHFTAAISLVLADLSFRLVERRFSSAPRLDAVSPPAEAPASSTPLAKTHGA